MNEKELDRLHRIMMVPGGEGITKVEPEFIKKCFTYLLDERAAMADRVFQAERFLGECLTDKNIEISQLKTEIQILKHMKKKVMIDA